MPLSYPNCVGAVIAVDTNIAVRLLTGDDAGQLQRARKLFEEETVFLPKTVLLETEWVLRSLYGLGTREVNRGLEGLVKLPQVQLEDPSAIAQALKWHREGLDFADALHVASSGPVERFVTFDRALARRAKAALTDTSVEVA